MNRLQQMNSQDLHLLCLRRIHSTSPSFSIRMKRVFNSLNIFLSIVCWCKLFSVHSISIPVTSRRWSKHQRMAITNSCCEDDSEVMFFKNEMKFTKKNFFKLFCKMSVPCLVFPHFKQHQTLFYRMSICFSTDVRSNLRQWTWKLTEWKKEESCRDSTVLRWRWHQMSLFPQCFCKFPVPVDEEGDSITFVCLVCEDPSIELTVFLWVFVSLAWSRSRWERR